MLWSCSGKCLQRSGTLLMHSHPSEIEFDHCVEIKVRVVELRMFTVQKLNHYYLKIKHFQSNNKTIYYISSSEQPKTMLGRTSASS
jgi:hypothetical protein